MEYSDLVNIIRKCRGVKRITLCNMKINNDVMDAIALTRVETLVFSQCELFRSNNGRYHSITLNFNKISDRIISELKPESEYYDSNYRAYADLIFNKAEDSSVNFENLKTIALFDCKYGSFLIENPQMSHHYLKDSENIDIENILLGGNVNEHVYMAECPTITCFTTPNHRQLINFIGVQSQISST